MVGWNTKYIGGVDSSDSYIVDLVEIFLDLWFGHGLGDSENVGGIAQILYRRRR